MNLEEKYIKLVEDYTKGIQEIMSEVSNITGNSPKQSQSEISEVIKDQLEYDIMTEELHSVDNMDGTDE